jgi:hypothetical protein
MRLKRRKSIHGYKMQPRGPTVFSAAEQEKAMRENRRIRNQSEPFLLPN